MLVRVSPRCTLWVLGLAGFTGLGGGGVSCVGTLAAASTGLVIGPIRTSADCTLLAISCFARSARLPPVQLKRYSQAMRAVALIVEPAGMALSASHRGLRLRSARM